MATLMPSPTDTGMAAFRAALPDGLANSAIANALCAIGMHKHLAKCEALAGDPINDRLIYITAGSAKLVAQPLAAGEAAGTVQVLAFHFAGDMVSVLRDADGDFRLIALADCRLIAFGTDAFLDIAQADPAVLRWVLRRSLQALDRSRTRMMQLGHKSARQRIADFLVSMAERFSDGSATGTGGACRLILPMSRRDIGDSLGLTIETVSRQFTELREAGLIETRGRSLVQLRDLAALAQAAGQTRFDGPVQKI